MATATSTASVPCPQLLPGRPRIWRRPNANGSRPRYWIVGYMGCQWVDGTPGDSTFIAEEMLDLTSPGTILYERMGFSSLGTLYVAIGERACGYACPRGWAFVMDGADGKAGA